MPSLSWRSEVNRPHQPSTPPNCSSFQISSKYSKKKYAVPLAFAWHTKSLRKICKFATDALAAPFDSAAALDEFYITWKVCQYSL